MKAATVAAVLLGLPIFPNAVTTTWPNVLDGLGQEGRWTDAGPCAHFLAALTLAQRALCAAAILLRPAAEMVLFFRLDFLPRR